MKLLLYCTKGKPLFRSSGDYDDDWGFNNFFDEYVCARDYYNYHRDYETVDEEDLLNGKIVAECDFEVEEISVTYADYYHEELAYDTNILTYDELLEKSCLNNQQLDNYLYGDNGYAIHIKNLHIFNKPRELKDYYKQLSSKEYFTKINELGYRPKEWLNVPVFISKYLAVQSILEPLKNAPQNMMYICEYDKSTSIEDYYKTNILISIHPEWLCKILNGEKTIEVRRKILQVMKNEI